jgi:hypothetical protein
MTKARDIASATTPNANAALLATFPHRNLIINGAMQVAQRGTSTSNVTSSGYHATDRWQIANSSLGTWTVSQSTTAPDGFSDSFKMDCTTADASPAASDFLIFRQHVEAQNLQHLKFGTSSAQSLTLSFWVRSSKTGTYIAELLQPDASNRHINKSYTISSAGTWEYKTITFAGDTSGVINNDNGTGFQVNWWLGSGSDYTGGTLQTSWGAVTSANRAVGQVNLADSTSNEWYITGVQLELGSTATPFEHRSFGEELARCQRYFMKTQPQSIAADTWSWDGAPTIAPNTGSRNVGGTFPVTMRTVPTVTTMGLGGTTGKVFVSGADETASVQNAGELNFRLQISGGGVGIGEDAAMNYKADAEL